MGKQEGKLGGTIIVVYAYPFLISFFVERFFTVYTKRREESMKMLKQMEDVRGVRSIRNDGPSCGSSSKPCTVVHYFVQLGRPIVLGIGSFGCMIRFELLRCIRIERFVGLGWRRMEQELGGSLVGWRCPRRKLGRRRRRRFLEHMAYAAIFHRTSCLELVGIGGSECGIVGQWQVGQSSRSRFLGIERFELQILGQVGMAVVGQLEQIAVGSTVVEWLWFGSSVGFELGSIGMAAFGLELGW